MIRSDGFYITSKKYMVVDTPVFDEISEGIQIIQFFPQEKEQGGSVLIAEFGVLEPHPIKINVKELCDELQSHTQHFSEQERNEIFYKINNLGEFPKWFDILESEIFEKRRDSCDFPHIYSGIFTVKNTTKFSLYPEKEVSSDYNSAEGKIIEDELSLVFHYGNRDMLSIFKFIAFS